MKSLFAFTSSLAILSVFGGIVWALHNPVGSISSPSFRGPELLFAASILLSSFTAMIGSRIWFANYKTENDNRRRTDIGAPPPGTSVPLRLPISRFLIDRKMHSARGLLSRDIGPLTFDVATHSDLAEISEYRGIIHWNRDVIEKLLSVFLLFVFSIFLGRATLYFIDFVRGGTYVREFIMNDVETAALFIGLALIIDGILLVASMTDAPGIGRTLDSLIVVLAGVTIMYFDPYKIFVSSIDNIGLYLVLMISLLFLVRWIIRHHTIGEWWGKDQVSGVPEMGASPSLSELDAQSGASSPTTRV